MSYPPHPPQSIPPPHLLPSPRSPAWRGTCPRRPSSGRRRGCAGTSSSSCRGRRGRSSRGWGWSRRAGPAPPSWCARTTWSRRRTGRASRTWCLCSASGASCRRHATRRGTADWRAGGDAWGQAGGDAGLEGGRGRPIRGRAGTSDWTTGRNVWLDDRQERLIGR